MTQIDQLNQRFGDALGYVRGGTVPRFCWKYGPELPYWRSRLGKVWVLAQWKRPEVTVQEWQTKFAGRYPYPETGMYHPHSEAKLAPGRLPSQALTEYLIRTLDQQMSTSYMTHLCNVQNEIAIDREADYWQWFDRVQDSAPAFNNFAPGARGGHVSYGGV